MTTFTKTLATFTTAALLTVSADAATFVSNVKNGDIFDVNTWTPVPGAMPVAPDGNIWEIGNQNVKNVGTGTFYGGTIVIDDRNLSVSSNTDLTVQDVEFTANNGKLSFSNKNSDTLFGNNMDLTGAKITQGRNSTTDFTTFTGSGIVKIESNNPNIAYRHQFVGDLTGFTGTFQVDIINGTTDGQGTTLGFGQDIAPEDASFNIVLGDFDGGGTGQNLIKDQGWITTGRYWLENHVAVTGLNLQDTNEDSSDPDPANHFFVTEFNIDLAPGTYTLDTVANPGAIDLATIVIFNDGVQDYYASEFFRDHGGTITVIPEPGSLALLGLGGLLVAARRRRG